jgi:hypothetical protein
VCRWSIDIYHISFPNDKRGIKLLGTRKHAYDISTRVQRCAVFGIFLLELLQVCLSAADIFYWFGSGYGDMNHLMSTHLSSFDTPMIGSITSFIVQIFFCYRIWALRRSFWPLCVLIAAVSSASSTAKLIIMTMSNLQISITQAFGGIAGGVRVRIQIQLSIRDYNITTGISQQDFLIGLCSYRGCICM